MVAASNASAGCWRMRAWNSRHRVGQDALSAVPTVSRAVMPESISRRVCGEGAGDLVIPWRSGERADAGRRGTGLPGNVTHGGRLADIGVRRGVRGVLRHCLVTLRGTYRRASVA